MFGLVGRADGGPVSSNTSEMFVQVGVSGVRSLRKG